MSPKPKTIDDYLAPLRSEKRVALENLRTAIQSASPKAQECISYGIPAFRIDGRLLVAFGAAANHCAFYPGAYPITAHRGELEAYDTSKGTIRFQARSPLPAKLVRKLVKARIAEHAARQPVAARGASSIRARALSGIRVGLSARHQMQRSGAGDARGRAGNVGFGPPPQEGTP